MQEKENGQNFKARMRANHVEHGLATGNTKKGY
jgi:hypothetical protein